MAELVTIPARSGKAARVSQGQRIKVVNSHGTQVVDAWAFNALDLTEPDVHDVLNVFQVTGLTPEGRYFVKPSPARTGDFVEFFAEIDVLCAISVCPHGDLSVAVWGPGAGDALATCRPLGVEIWQPASDLLAGWKPPAASDYRGGHGLRSGS